MKRGLLIIVLALTVLLGGGAIYLVRGDSYQADGQMSLGTLSAAVRVVRDERGVPYIFADSLDDAIRAQGFVTAQDRLFQMEVSRYLAHGRLAELIGEAGLKSDIPVRVAGVPRLAARHARMMSGPERHLREVYLEGLNAYVREHQDEHPVAFRLLGLRPQPWTLEDSVTLSYFLNWSSSANLATELLAQMIIDQVGPERAAEIAQLTVNPDDDSFAPTPVSAATPLALTATRSGWAMWAGEGAWPYQVGSNNWVVSGSRTMSGAPILANDPHIDSRTLPGIWHPVGIIIPGLRAVGVAGSGIPGFAVARTERIAYGLTNSYGDVMDLYIESVDRANPSHYMERGASVPFQIIDEVLRVRDRSQPGGYRDVPLRIRMTGRGPVISDHGMGVADGKLLSLRWSVAEAMEPDDTGGTSLFLARSVAEAGVAVSHINAPYNYVVADADGNIGHFTAGRVPIRRVGDGSVPLPADAARDAWAGFIPAAQMPGMVNPARGWVGTANHRTVPASYPYAYSNYFAASWRYRRMIELIDPPARRDATAHWRFMWDTRNLMAARAAPILQVALAAHADTADLARRLADWDLRDDPNEVGPSIFQSVVRHFAELTFRDELGEELTRRLLEAPYYWQERLVQLMQENAAGWFDDKTTSALETRDDMIHRAGLLAIGELGRLMGQDRSEWRWGRIHTVTFFSPMLPGHWPAQLLGGGTRPKDGSGETLNRAAYRFGEPYEVTYIASMRFLADMGDSDKVMMVLSGGASGRQFDAHLQDELAAWRSGEPAYLWFSTAQIDAHARHELQLVAGK